LAKEAHLHYNFQMKVAAKNKILVIEDDPAILTGLEDFLSAKNYEIVTSQDGLEGLNIALNEHPDLILLDLNLPSLNGLEVCRKLREEKFLNPILIITASDEQIDEIVGLEIGADDFIKKPYKLREVLARIRANLRRSEWLSTSTDDDSESLGDQRIKRNLKCVMFTDIKDYSKKMHSDEHSALLLLQNHNQIMEDAIYEHRGKIIEIIAVVIICKLQCNT